MVWFIVAMPVLLTLLCVMLEVANLYLARTELDDALEAAAQAAVKDWGDNGGGDTLQSRIVGNTYAKANTINGVPVDLTAIDPALNYDASEPCNQNACSNGVLVFGAITADNPEFTFDCCANAGCSVGTVQLDVSAQSALGGSNNEWGISFQPNFLPPPPVRIVRVVYTLPRSCGTLLPRFDASTTTNLPVVSNVVTDDPSNATVQDMCPTGQSAQADVYGINRSAVRFFMNVTNPCQMNNGDEVTATPNATPSRTLAVQFPDAGGDLNGFDIFDRIRFGATVRDLNGGQIGGDQIGACMTQVTICFNNGATCTGMFQDLNFKQNQCFPNSNQKCAGLASWGVNEFPGNPQGGQLNRGLIIHPTGTPDLPCPPSSGQNNDGQSTATVVSCAGGGSGRSFAVRAEATYPVPSICCNLFGLPVGPFYVTAKADALYDCPTQRPRLYHLEQRNYSCNVNCP